MATPPDPERPRPASTAPPPDDAALLGADHPDAPAPDRDVVGAAGRAEVDALRAASAPLAPRVWVPASVEAAFYRLNQLPPRLDALFAGVAGPDPDEDDVEDLAPEARALIAEHALMDLFVEAFYEALAPLPARVRVRRLGAAGRVAPRGRPALLALRAAWADDFGDEAILRRLRAGGALTPPPRPTVVHADDVLRGDGFVDGDGAWTRPAPAGGGAGDASDPA